MSYIFYTIITLTLLTNSTVNIQAQTEPAPTQLPSQDRFQIAPQVNIASPIAGDAIIIARQVDLNAPISGDALILALAVTQNAPIDQDLRIISGHAVLNHHIKQNASILSLATISTPQASISGTLSSGNLIANLSGSISSLRLMSLMTAINASIGPAWINTRQLNISPQASFTGDIYLTSSPADVPQHLQQSNRLHLTPAPSHQLSLSLYQTLQKGFAHVRIAVIITQLIIGLLAINIMPNFMTRSLEFIEARPIHTGVWGIAVYLLLSLCGLVLLLIPFTTSLGIVVASLCLLVVLTAPITSIYWLGSRFLTGLKRSATKGNTYIVGILLFFMLTSISAISLLLFLLSLIWGIGAFVQTLRKWYRSSRKLRLI